MVTTEITSKNKVQILEKLKQAATEEILYLLFKNKDESHLIGVE